MKSGIDSDSKPQKETSGSLFEKLGGIIEMGQRVALGDTTLEKLELDARAAKNWFWLIRIPCRHGNGGSGK